MKDCSEPPYKVDENAVQAGTVSWLSKKKNWNAVMVHCDAVMIQYHDRIHINGFISSGINHIVCICYRVLRTVMTMRQTLSELAANAARGMKTFRWKATCATTAMRIRQVLWHYTDINDCLFPTRLGSTNLSFKL